MNEDIFGLRRFRRCRSDTWKTPHAGTTARGLELTGRTGGICENMEGAGAALACRQTGVPFMELRGISNLVEDRETARA